MSANVRTLRDVCNSIATQATNEEAKRKLLSLSNEAVRSMSDCIQRSADWSDDGRRITMSNAQAATTNIDRLVSFITSTTDFGGEPARISGEAREVSDRLCGSSLQSFDSCTHYRRIIYTRPKNPSAWLVERA